MPNLRVSLCGAVVACAALSLRSLAALPALEQEEAGARLDVPFTLGPYDRDVWPVPVEMALEGDLVQEHGLTAEELDARGTVTARYACHTVGGGTASVCRVTFIPWSATDPDSWKAGGERRFVIRNAAWPEVARQEGDFVRVAADSIVLSNRYYAMTLAPVKTRLSGAADVIRRVAFGAQGRVFHPNSCQGELAVDGRRYFTRFDPAVEPVLRRHGGEFVQVTYGGRFHDGDTALEGVSWRLTLTGYATLPLVKVRFERYQTAEALSGGLCTFQSFLKLSFNGRDRGRHPFDAVRCIPHSASDRRDLLAAGGAGALLAFLMPDGRTFGACYYDPDTTGYAFLSMEHESRNTIRSREARAGEVVREGYLLATGDTVTPEGLAEIWWSLSLMREADWRIRLRRLFESAGSTGQSGEGASPALPTMRPRGTRDPHDLDLSRSEQTSHRRESS